MKKIKHTSSNQEKIKRAFERQETKKLGYFFSKEQLWIDLNSIYENPFQYSIDNNLKLSYLYLLKNYYEKVEIKDIEFKNKDFYKRFYFERKKSFSNFIEKYKKENENILKFKKNFKRA